MKIISLVLVLLLMSGCAQKKIKTNSNWTFARSLDTPPRGGITYGGDVQFNHGENSHWSRLHEKGISSYEKDRRAIYALQGEFKVEFEFIESYLIDKKAKMDGPYRSWATEFVEVIEDKGSFISLQHILVLQKKDLKTNKLSEPYIVKHWRQDWHWQGQKMLVYNGEQEWNLKSLKSSERMGKWVWSTFQVDDSPRYSGIGKWAHYKNASIFETGDLSRPLPRRERTFRSDYQVLLGRDMLVVTKDNWYHEQKNLKQAFSSKKDGDRYFLSRELGQNSYLRIKGFNFTPGKNYWEKTREYWKTVRNTWNKIKRNKKRFVLHKEVDGTKLYEQHFKQAKDDHVLKLSKLDQEKLVEKTIYQYIKK